MPMQPAGVFQRVKDSGIRKASPAYELSVDPTQNVQSATKLAHARGEIRFKREPDRVSLIRKSVTTSKYTSVPRRTTNGTLYGSATCLRRLKQLDLSNRSPIGIKRAPEPASPLSGGTRRATRSVGLSCQIRVHEPHITGSRVGKLAIQKMPLGAT